MQSSRHMHRYVCGLASSRCDQVPLGNPASPGQHHHLLDPQAQPMLSLWPATTCVPVQPHRSQLLVCSSPSQKLSHFHEFGSRLFLPHSNIPRGQTQTLAKQQALIHKQQLEGDLVPSGKLWGFSKHYITSHHVSPLHTDIKHLAKGHATVKICAYSKKESSPWSGFHFVQTMVYTFFGESPVNTQNNSRLSSTKCCGMSWRITPSRVSLQHNPSAELTYP